MCKQRLAQAPLFEKEGRRGDFIDAKHQDMLSVNSSCKISPNPSLLKRGIRSVQTILQALIVSLFFANSLTAKSFATLDWTVAETLLALGEKPVAVGDAKSYRIWVNEPQLPTDTLDLGVRLQPNAEQVLALQQSKEIDDLTFINSSFYTQTTSTLEKFSRVENVDFYTDGEAWGNVVSATYQIGELIGKPQAAAELMQRYLQKIAEIRPLVAAFSDRPIALVQFADSRHLRIYGKNSPFGAVLNQLGFENAWKGEVGMWGTDNINVTQLADLPPNSRLVVVKPYPSHIATALQYNTLWKKLDLARDPLILPAIWTFGGIPSAQRFATAFATALQNGGEKW